MHDKFKEWLKDKDVAAESNKEQEQINFDFTKLYQDICRKTNF